MSIFANPAAVECVVLLVLCMEKMMTKCCSLHPVLPIKTQMLYALI